MKDAATASTLAPVTATAATTVVGLAAAAAVAATTAAGVAAKRDSTPAQKSEIIELMVPLLTLDEATEPAAAVAAPLHSTLAYGSTINSSAIVRKHND